MARQPTTTEQTKSEGSQQAGEQRRPRHLARGYDPFGLVLTPLDLFRANPFSLFRQITDELDRAASAPAQGGAEKTWCPPIELQQGENNIVVRAELPGLNPDDVTIDVVEDAIVISGERQQEQDADRRGVRLTERRYGRFMRTIPLPDGAQPDQATARFENGILEITIPVRERQSERRQIQIQGSGAGGPTSGSSGRT